MHKANKWLLIWNLVLTVLVVTLIAGGCTTTDTRVPWLVTQAQLQSVEIQQLKATVDQNRQLIQNMGNQILALDTFAKQINDQLTKLAAK